MLLFSCWIHEFKPEGEPRGQDQTHKCAELGVTGVTMRELIEMYSLFDQPAQLVWLNGLDSSLIIEQYSILLPSTVYISDCQI